MKKLSTKEKAELYDKAIKKAKSKVLYPGKPCFVNIKDIFPELVESEDLEIKSDIQYAVRCVYGDNSSKTERILAWLDKQGELVEINPTEFDTRLQALIGKSGSLPKEELIGSLSFWMNVVQNDGTYKEEKQGEQNPADKVEPKFHEGDWVVSKLDRKARQISEVHCDEYNDYYIVEGDEYQIEEYDRLHHLWTIQDAKDGDVLAAKSGNRIFLYNGNCDLRHRPCAYCGTYKGFSEILFSKCAIGNYFTDEDVYPATKEQRNLLFQKMKEAGYEWDAEKKELKKIEQKPTLDVEIPFGVKDSELKEATYFIPKGFYVELIRNEIRVKRGKIEFNQNM